MTIKEYAVRTDADPFHDLQAAASPNRSPAESSNQPARSVSSTHGKANGLPSSEQPFLVLFVKSGGLTEVYVNSRGNEFSSCDKAFDSISAQAREVRQRIWRQALAPGTLSGLLDLLVPVLFPGHAVRHERPQGPLWVVAYRKMYPAYGTDPYHYEMRFGPFGDVEIEFEEFPSETAIVVGLPHYEHRVERFRAAEVTQASLELQHIVANAMTAVGVVETGDTTTAWRFPYGLIDYPGPSGFSSFHLPTYLAAALVYLLNAIKAFGQRHPPASPPQADDLAGDESDREVRRFKQSQAAKVQVARELQLFVGRHINARYGRPIAIGVAILSLGAAVVAVLYGALAAERSTPWTIAGVAAVIGLAGLAIAYLGVHPERELESLRRDFHSTFPEGSKRRELALEQLAGSQLLQDVATGAGSLE